MPDMPHICQYVSGGVQDTVDVDGTDLLGVVEVAGAVPGVWSEGRGGVSDDAPSDSTRPEIWGSGGGYTPPWSPRPIGSPSQKFYHDSRDRWMGVWGG